MPGQLGGKFWEGSWGWLGQLKVTPGQSGGTISAESRQDLGEIPQPLAMTPLEFFTRFDRMYYLSFVSVFDRMYHLSP